MFNKNDAALSLMQNSHLIVHHKVPVLPLMNHGLLIPTILAAMMSSANNGRYLHVYFEYRRLISKSIDVPR